MNARSSSRVSAMFVVASNLKAILKTIPSSLFMVAGLIGAALYLSLMKLLAPDELFR